MARTVKTTSAEPVAKAVVSETQGATADIVAEENMNENVEVSETGNRSRASKKAKESKGENVEEAQLNDTDEIEVVNLIPNVVYEDERTSDYYQWDRVGQVETMTFDAIKAMHRKYKAYFSDMWLKPLDERVIKRLGLSRNYDKYNYLMDESNYTAENIDKVLEGIFSVSSGLRMAIVTRLKDMVSEGVISDIKVIKKLENRLDIELISFL